MNLLDPIRSDLRITKQILLDTVGLLLERGDKLEQLSTHTAKLTEGVSNLAF